MDGNGEKPTNPDVIPEMVAIARYNTNGSLDNTVTGVLVQADGKIVAVEAVGTIGIALARCLAN
jgi:hypothetical protein